MSPIVRGNEASLQKPQQQKKKRARSDHGSQKPSAQQLQPPAQQQQQRRRRQWQQEGQHHPAKKQKRESQPAEATRPTPPPGKGSEARGQSSKVAGKLGGVTSLDMKRRAGKGGKLWKQSIKMGTVGRQQEGKAVRVSPVAGKHGSEGIPKVAAGSPTGSSGGGSQGCDLAKPRKRSKAAVLLKAKQRAVKQNAVKQKAAGGAGGSSEALVKVGWGGLAVGVGVQASAVCAVNSTQIWSQRPCFGCKMVVAVCPCCHPKFPKAHKMCRGRCMHVCLHLKHILNAHGIAPGLQLVA